MTLVDTALVALADVPTLDHDTVVDWHKQHLNPALVALMKLGGYDGVSVASADGAWITTTDGRRLLDLVSSYGALSHGHNHPRMLAASRWFDEQHAADLLKEFPSPWAATLAHNLAALTPGKLDTVFLCNSGTEAVEGALKLAQRAFAGKRDRFVYARDSLHGKTGGTLSVTGREKYRRHVRRFEDWPMVPFGDLAALEAVFAADAEKRIAGLVLEPIQGEAGVVVPPDGYLAAAAELCARHSALLILDEIQTAFGRTGSMFRCEAEGVVPDVLCVAKSLGGGVATIGATITRPDLHARAYGKINDCLVHTSTFGGRARSAALAIEALAIAVDEDFAGRSRRLGARFREALERLVDAHPTLLAGVRGEGLMLGLEFHKPRLSGLSTAIGVVGMNRVMDDYLPGMIGAQLLKQHNIVASFVLNNPRVLRLYPPLTVDEADLMSVPPALDAVLSQGLGRIVADSLAGAVNHAGLSTLRGWIKDW